MSFPLSTTRTALGLLLVAACAAVAGGCACCQLPRIDPTGQQLFVWPGETAPVYAPLQAVPVGAPIATAPVVVAPPPATGNLQAAPVYSDVPAAPLTTAPPPSTGTFGNPLTPTVIGPPVAVVPTAAIAPASVQVPPPGAVPVGVDHVRLNPDRVMAPIGSEVVLKAGICGGDGYLHADRRIEWLLSHDGAGQFVDLGYRGEVDVFRLPWNTPRKVDNWYAIGSTAYAAQCLDHGTPDPRDDIQVVRGEAWISVTSASEGTSRVTAYAPDIDNWQFRQASATIYWVDAQWTFPPSAVAEPGRPYTLTTSLTRRSDGAPLTGWIVRYDVSGGGSLGYAGGNTVDSTTDATGRASVEVSPNNAGGGTSTIGVTIIRPAVAGPDATPQLEVGRGAATISWGVPKRRRRQPRPRPRCSRRRSRP